MYNKKFTSYIIIFITVLLYGCSPHEAKIRGDKGRKFNFSRENKKKKKEKKYEKREPFHYDNNWISPIHIDYKKYEKNSPLNIVLQKGHTDQITDLAVSPDGKYIVTGSHDRTIKIWAINGILLKTIPVHGRIIYTVFFHPGGERFGASLAAGSRYSSALTGKTIKFWDINGKPVKTYEGKEYNAAKIVYSPDGKTIVTSSGYNNIDIRDGNWKIRKTIKAGRYKVNSLAFSPDGKFFAAGVSPYKTRLGWISSSAMWTKDGIFVRDIDVVKPQNIGGGKKIKWRGNVSPGDVNWVTFSPNGKFIATAGSNNIINIRTIEGNLVHNFKMSFVKRLFFTPDSKMIIASGSHHINIFSMDGRELRSYYLRSREEPGNNVSCSDITPDGKTIVTGFGSPATGLVRVWNINGDLKKNLGNNGIEFQRVLFSPGLKRLILETDNAYRRKSSRRKKRNNKIKNEKYSDKKSYVWKIESNIIEEIEERIGFTNKNEEVRFSKGWGVFHYKNSKGNFKYKAHYSRRLQPLPDGNLLHYTPGTLTFYNVDGEPLQRITYRHGGTSGIGGVDSYGTGFSPGMKYFIIETSTSHGRIHGIALLNFQGKIIKRFRVNSRLSTAAIGPWGNYIATGHKNGNINIWSKEGRHIKKLTGHVVDINGISFSRDRNYIVSTSKDRTTRIWNLKTGKSIILVIYKTGDWVVFNEKGYFDCSDRGRQYVKFIKGMTVYNFQQFWTDFFVPGFISNVIKSKKTLSSNIALRVKNTPSVKIFHDAAQRKNRQDPVAALRVCARPKDNGVGNIFLFHNGRAIDEKTRGLSIVSKGECKIFKIKLLPGENIISGAAYDRDNAVFGRSSQIKIQYIPEKIVTPDMYVLAVGVSRYRDKNISLGSPADDAEAISGIFDKTGSSLYGNVITTVLTNDKASKKNIIQSMDKIINSAKKIDTVILFFAGHGDIEKNRYYFLGYNADITNLKESGLSIDDISSFTRRLSANKIAIFFDTCKSGRATEIIGNLAMARGFEDRKIIANLARERGIAVFSAASKTQDAFEIKALGHGIFTYSILDALKNNKDEISNGNLISIGKLLSFVNRLTRDRAYKYLKVDQSPILYFFGDDFSIGLVK